VIEGFNTAASITFEGLEFSDLSISLADGGTVIRSGARDQVILAGFTGTLDASDFLFA